MENQTGNNLTLLAISLTVIVTVSMTSGPLTLWDFIVGSVLAICLWNFRTKPIDPRMTIPLAMIWGFCALITFGVVIDSVYSYHEETILNFTNQKFGEQGGKLFWSEAPLSFRHLLSGVFWALASGVSWFFVRKLDQKKSPQESDAAQAEEASTQAATDR